ncbi:MAG: hypothetical protein RBR77_10645 [Thauera sp.]|jgi:hypothetical protein|nr:hypothetical protein [Thauera sp.]
MNRIFNLLAFALGLAVVLWVGVGYVGRSNLALLMTVLIAAVYLLGASELWRFNRASAALANALSRVRSGGTATAQVAANEGSDWLNSVPAPLAAVVRQRLGGEAAAFPGPALSPYLVGMLVLLGMLGTFLGMVMTLDGAVQALEMSTDLQAMRSALAAPVKGLGVAFGTSVAGVAASAMLGLLLALARRERVRLGQQLNRLLQDELRPHSLAWQRTQAYAALNSQAEDLPRLVDRMEQMMNVLLSRDEASQAAQRSAQAEFQAHSRSEFEALALRLEHGMQQQLAVAVGQAGDALQVLTSRHAEQAAQAASALQDQLGSGLQQLLAELARHSAASADALERALSAQLEQQRAEQRAATQALHQAGSQFSAQFTQQADALLDGFSERLLAIEQQLAAQAAQQCSSQEHSLAQFSSQLGTQWQSNAEAARVEHRRLLEHVGEALREMLAEQAGHNRQQRSELEALLSAAAVAPQAAGEVLSRLDERVSTRIASEQAMLAAHQQLLVQMQTVLDRLDASAGEQAAASTRLVGETAHTLGELGSAFAAHSAAQRDELAASSGELQASALEIASLGDAFALAVGRFADSNAQLGERLHSIEQRLEQSLQRSDEQLAYYIAQARELIDLSLLSQQRLLAELNPAASTTTADGAD